MILKGVYKPIPAQITYDELLEWTLGGKHGHVLQGLDAAALAAILPGGFVVPLYGGWTIYDMSQNARSIENKNSSPFIRGLDLCRSHFRNGACCQSTF